MPLSFNCLMFCFFVCLVVWFGFNCRVSFKRIMFIKLSFTGLGFAFLVLNENKNFCVCSSDVLASQEQQMNEIVTIDQREYSCP